MFPHKIDRYRILRYLLKQARNSFRQESGEPGLTQDQLEERLKRDNILTLTQPTISNLERLKYVNKFAKSKGKIKRENLLPILMKGLQLPQMSIDAMLWILEGKDFKPCDEYELHRYGAYLGDTIPQTYGDYSILRNKVLDSLEQLVKERPDTDSSRGSTKVNVWMIFGSDPGQQVQENRQLLTIEKEAGQRMFVSKYPSFLAYKDDWKRWSDVEKVCPQDREEYARITTERREKFLENLKDYGERSIHSLESLRAYASKEKLPHYFNLDERRHHLENWISLLEPDQYPLYEVGLIDTPPELEFFIKSTLTVSVTGARAYGHSGEEEITCGPRSIDWRDPTSVLSFLIDFEREWHRIPRACRERESVVRELKALL